MSIYTVEFIRGYKTSIEHNAIEKAKVIALEVEMPIRVYLDGFPKIVVVPKSYSKITIIQQGERIVKIDAKGKNISCQFEDDVEKIDTDCTNSLDVVRRKYDSIYSSVNRASYHNHKRIAIRG